MERDLRLHQLNSCAGYEYEYLRRNIEKKAKELLNFFPVVIVLGVLQCGKNTWQRC